MRDIIKMNILTKFHENIPFGTKVIIRKPKVDAARPPDQPPARRQTQSNNQNFFSKNLVKNRMATCQGSIEETTSGLLVPQLAE